jgi:hypothetical protein
MNVISMSLYGREPKYVTGALENAALAPRIYPGWELWAYTEPGHPAIAPLMEAGAVVWTVSRSSGHEGMFWRFLAAGEPGVERVIFRDADSRLNHREKAAVDEWIAEGTGFHVMRDHADHAQWPILGGMFGVRGGVLPDIRQRIERWPRRTEKLDDMRFLAHEIWPLAIRSMTHHSSVPTPHPHAKPYPPHEPVEGFVGAIVDAAV